MTTIDIPTPSPTPLSPEQIVEQLRLLRQHVPEYQQLSGIEAKRLGSGASVSPAFVQTSINAVGALPKLRSALDRTPEELREETEDAARWTSVEEELRAMLKGVAAANLTRRHRIGQTALHAYGIGRQLARRPENTDLLPHLDELARLRRAHRRRKTPAAQKPALPQTSSPAASPGPADAPSPAPSTVPQTTATKV